MSDSGPKNQINGGERPPTPPRSRLEAEVLEILERSEKPIPFTARVRRLTWRRRRQRLTEALARPFRYVADYSARSIAVAAVICAVLALFLNDAAPIVGRIAGFAFIILIGLFFFVGFKGGPGGRGGQGTRRWRGRNIDFDASRDKGDGGRWRR
jgi:hypothetical protein